MISQLTGTLAAQTLKYIVIDVNGVGYKVFTTGETMARLSKMPEGKVTLMTYLAVRENALDLYGFPSAAELAFFELLNTVSGIGPKTALGILNVASLRSLETAIQTGDTSHITKVAGIGKKVAEKIVLELKDKIDDLISTPELEHAMKNDADALDALTSLGYSQNEARDALKKIPKTIVDTGAKIREALKMLGK